MGLKERSRSSNGLQGEDFCVLHERIERIADRSCLEPLAGCHVRAARLVQEWHRILEHPSSVGRAGPEQLADGCRGPFLRRSRRAPAAKEALKRVNLEFTVGIEDRAP